MANNKTSAPAEVEELLAVYTELLIPFMKVRRDMPFPTELGRQETDGEHAFTLAMLAITLAQKFDPTLDTGLIAQYALVHDLVEAYAGDVSVRADEAAHAAKAANEHAAYLQIEQKFRKSAPWIADCIKRYEDRTDREARFVYTTDKLMGSFARLADNGDTWADYYPEPDGSGYHRSVKRLRAKAAAYPELLPLFDALHQYLDGEWPKYLQKHRNIAA
jgi:5'-deoxynucleotidase YfbR-like HD superfamily hydrolase